MSSPRFPEPPAAVAPTPRETLDAAVERVASHKDEWTRLGIPERIRLLERCIDGLVGVAEEWVADACRAKGLSPDGTSVAAPPRGPHQGDSLAGEEWIAGPSSTIRNARLLVRSLESLGQRRPPKVYAREDGQLVVRVFPADGYEKAMFAGITAEVWIEPGRPASQGRIYREASGAGRVALVLGAGNVSSIAPMDAFYKLFVENEVVVLKTNPVNAYLGVHWERALAPLIEAGYLAIVHGGGKEGAYLAEHPRIDTLHVTGSDKTYDAIVWGSSTEEQARRKAAHDPKNRRPFTAELGCVTPVLVVPGPWSAADMDYQARQVAGMVAHNASFNCTAAKVLVVAKGWLQREAFLRKVEAALASAPPRKAYYPGATDRWRSFLDRYPRARVLGGGERADVVPWTLIPDVPAELGEYALSNEAFCGVLATVTLDASSTTEFLEKAVEFANERCWGTLSSTILVHPSTREEHPREVDRAVASLRYGAIGVNAWSSLAYALVSPTWGAFPGHPPEDIRSGSGVVHNSFLLDYPQKSVVFAPFRIRPKPVWFADHRNLLRVGRKLAEMEARPSVARLAGVAVEGLKG
jgi:acyl-CoA reductase-like NAD-dependent aldehyde dehydrogenase